MTKHMVAGVDVSLTGTGIALGSFDTERGLSDLVGTHLVKSKGAKDDDWDRRADRIEKIADEVAITVTPGSFVLMESPAYGAKGGSAHDRSGLWWAIFFALRKQGCQVRTAAPTQVKKYATGRGNADKDEVLAAVVRRYSSIDVSNNNIADASVLAAIAMRILGYPVDSPPANNQTVIKALGPIFELAR